MRLEICGRTLIAQIEGELDHHGANEIRKKLDDIIKKKSVKNLIFDFTKLSFMDSSGIGVIIGRYKLIKSAKGEVLVVSDAPRVDKLLSVSGLYKLLDVNKNLSSALKKVKEI